MGLTYNLRSSSISESDYDSEASPTTAFQEKLLDAIKAFLRIEPGVEATPDNIEVFGLINQYYSRSVTFGPAKARLLYHKLNRRLALQAVGTLAEEYIEELGIAPFPVYDDFDFSRWCAAVPQEQLELFPYVFPLVDNSDLFDSLPGQCQPPGKAVYYIAAAFAEKGITPDAVADRIYAVSRGCRSHAIASGLLPDE